MARYAALPTSYQGAYGYIEYLFRAGAGSLAVGRSSEPMLTSLHKQNWTDFAEADDYSYLAANNHVPNDHLAVYQTSDGPQAVATPSTMPPSPPAT